MADLPLLALLVGCTFQPTEGAYEPAETLWSWSNCPDGLDRGPLHDLEGRSMEVTSASITIADIVAPCSHDDRVLSCAVTGSEGPRTYFSVLATFRTDTEFTAATTFHTLD